MTDFIAHSTSPFGPLYQGSSAFLLCSGRNSPSDICYPHQVIGSADEPRLKMGSISSFASCSSETADGLEPSKDLFHSFSDPLADIVSFVPGGTAIDCRTASALGIGCNMWRDRAVPHRFYKTMGIVALVGSDGTGLYSLPGLPAEHLLGRFPFRVSCCRGNGDVDQAGHFGFPSGHGRRTRAWPPCPCFSSSSRDSGSVVEAWVLFDRFSPRKFTVGFPGSSSVVGRSEGSSSLGRKLFKLAQASMRVPSTVK